MKAQSLKKRFEQTINALNEALASLYLLTEGLTLLETINTMAVELAQAIEVLLEDVEQAEESELIDLLKDSDVLVLLDELQDTNLISDLESTLLDATGDTANPELIEFVTELIEKIEIKYNHLLEAAHAFNALIPNHD